MVKDVTKFPKHHLGDRGMLECVCICRVSYRILSFGRGRGELQSSVLTWKKCIAHTARGVKNRCSEIDSEAFWGY